MAVLAAWRFCPRCGAAAEPEGGEIRCPACGYVAYANPVPGAEAVCFDKRGRILLGRRAVDPGAGLWDLPGGFLHEDEHPLEALRREVREETALELESLAFLGIWMEPYDERIVLCLTWTALAAGEPRPGDDLVELCWFEPDALPGAAELAFSHYPAALSAAIARDKHP